MSKYDAQPPRSYRFVFSDGRELTIRPNRKDTDETLCARALARLRPQVKILPEIVSFGPVPVTDEEKRRIYVRAPASPTV